MSVSLAARGLAAGYGARAVLHDLDVAFEPSRVTAIVGPNGAGKSTLLRALAGLLAPARGVVTLDGVDLATLGRREVARRVAVVPQVFELLFPLTVREVVALGRTPHLGFLATLAPSDLAAIERTLAELELLELADRRVDTLSGGERQRAVLAMALAQEAAVLLLDEPTVHLDPAHQRATLALVRREARRRELTVVAVLHDLNLASVLCDRMVVLRAGRIVADGLPAAVLDQATVDSVFGPGLRVLAEADLPVVVPRQ